ncbi:MAG: phosphatidylglycerophosphatase A family protein [Planctomycetota bacterium]
MTIVDRILYVLITGFGTGLAPVASGTFGTIPAVVLAVVLQIWWQGPQLALILFVLAAVLLALGCSTSGFVERIFEGKDPGAFVLDEIVGYLLALGMIALVMKQGPSPWAHAWCFLLFRAFDVLKLPPADRLEEVPGAFGIMLDDVAAGVYAGCCLLVMHYFKLL